MGKIINQLMTGIDGQTHDVGRWLWALGVLNFMGLAFVAVYFKGQVFDPQAYGVGLGAVLAGGGLAIGAKAKTEPGGGA